MIRIASALVPGAQIRLPRMNEFEEQDTARGPVPESEPESAIVEKETEPSAFARSSARSELP